MSSLTTFSIVKKLEQHKQELRSFSVTKIGLFGSFLHGSATKVSDMDFLVTLNKPTFDNYMDLKFFLEKMFNRKVDLVLESSLKPALRYVLEEASYAKIA